MSKRFAALALVLMFLGASIGPALMTQAWAIVTCTVTNTFGSQSGTIPVSQIDTNFTDVKNCVNLAAAFTDLPLTRAYTGTQRFAKGANLTAAATLTLGSDGNYFTVTGNTGITAISSLEAGTVIWLTFTGTPALTHSSPALILLGATNYTAASGDVMEFLSDGGGNWREVWRRPVTSASTTTFFRGDGTWAAPASTANLGGGTTTLTTGDITTTSNTLTDATGVTVTITKAAAATDVLCGVTVTTSNGTAGGGTGLDLVVDGTSAFGSDGQRTANSSADTETFATGLTTRVSGLATGSRICKLQFRRTGGVGTVTLAANTTTKAVIWAKEVY